MANQQKKKNNLVNKIVICIIIAGFIGVIFTDRGYFDSPSKIKEHKLPLIKTQVKDEDNELRNVSVNLTLGGNEKAIEALEEIDEYDLAINAIKSLSYEELRGNNGTDLIKREVLRAINDNLASNNINKVYITGIDLGGANIPGMVDSFDEDNKKAQSDKLKQWFGN